MSGEIKTPKALKVHLPKIKGWNQRLQREHFNITSILKMICQKLSRDYEVELSQEDREFLILYLAKNTDEKNENKELYFGYLTLRAISKKSLLINSCDFSEEFSLIFDCLGLKYRQRYMVEGLPEYKEYYLLRSLYNCPIVAGQWLPWTKDVEDCFITYLLNFVKAVSLDWKEDKIAAGKPICKVSIFQSFHPVGVMATSLFSRFKGALFSKSRIDVFKEYLENIKLPPHIKPIEYVDGFMGRVFKIPDEYRLLADYWLKMLLYGCVKRTYLPGCKFDNVLGLQGKEGGIKSTFFRSLYPEDIVDYCHNEFSPLGQKDEKRFIIELDSITAESSEMADFFKLDENTQKSRISARVDKGTPIYSREHISNKRRVIFVYSGNEERFLPDDERNRRFIPLVVNNKFGLGKNEMENEEFGQKAYNFMKDYFNKHRDKLWAWGLIAFKSKQPPRLTEKTAIALQSLRDDSRKSPAVLEEAVYELVTPLKDTVPVAPAEAEDKKYGWLPNKSNGQFRMLDLCQAVTKRYPRIQFEERSFNQKVGRILLRMGFQKQKGVKRCGVVGNWWVYPLKKSDVAGIPPVPF